MTIVIFTSSIYILNKFRTSTDDLSGTLTRDAQQAIEAQLTAGQVVALAPSTVPNPLPLMLIGFALSLCGGMAIGFALAMAALIYIWAEGALPGVIFAQPAIR